MPRGRFEPHRRLRLGRQQPPERRDRALDRAQAHVDRQLPQQVLAHHLRIAAVPKEALLQPGLLSLELAAADRPAVGHPAVGRHVAPHRVLAAPELPRDALQPPTERMQMQHRLHLVGFHHLCPWPPCPRADILASIHLSDSSLAKGGQFSMSPGGQFPLSRDRFGERGEET